MFLMNNKKKDRLLNWMKCPRVFFYVEIYIIKIAWTKNSWEKSNNNKIYTSITVTV